MINRTKVVRRGSWTEAELAVALAVVCSAEREREKEWSERVSGGRRQAGVPLRLASARRGQGEQGAWWPRGDDGLTPVGHGRV